ncbi:hypothetical protein QFZ24_008694 [Streptomyces phaeochromogenes]|jgi:hypothetical protein|uniref:DUF7144 family membrane protein n=1 Tax=Streptomyces phaeochromogenes TaxID=1923 RepID=UPI00278E972F|nr:hypothetical protein [Streptomyces phaeochromogenes]MDQ0954771.1 hypothetical protein [Streptomyces phaeochromogenes]
MASHVAGSSTRREARSSFGSGWLVFAAVLMVFGGLMMAVAGISAIADDDVFVATRNYVWELDLAGWGWIHLVMGIVIFFAGLALFRGATWARVVGVALAGLSMIANFMWLPHAPVWALVLLTIDGFVIWALCAAPGLGRS